MYEIDDSRVVHQSYRCLAIMGHMIHMHELVINSKEK